jgi:hypothetical protein
MAADLAERAKRFGEESKSNARLAALEQQAKFPKWSRK